MVYLAGSLLLRLVRLGPLRISAFGLCAAAGLVGALWLSLRTARLVGIAPAALWDAGLAGVTAGFAVSRALLVARNWQAFVQYPAAVLALPSFTYAEMGITALIVVAYLRRQRLPVLRVMDAWAPCAALLAAALEVGHSIEGSDLGMPWGRQGALVPVQAMGAIAAAAIAVVLLWQLKRLCPEAAELKHYKAAGSVAGLGLLTGGLVAFGLAMVTQPLTSGGWLETGQWIAVVAMALGSILWLKLGKALR